MKREIIRSLRRPVQAAVAPRTSLSRSSLIQDSPANVDSDIAGQPTRKVDDFSFELETTWLQILAEPCNCALRHGAERSLYDMALNAPFTIRPRVTSHYD
jgi:hypothetical protein